LDNLVHDKFFNRTEEEKVTLPNINSLVDRLTQQLQAFRVSVRNRRKL